MCFSKPPGPSAQQQQLEADQIEQIAVQKELAAAEKQKSRKDEIDTKKRKLRGDALSTASFFGSKAGFGSTGTGSLFNPRKQG